MHPQKRKFSCRTLDAPKRNMPAQTRKRQIPPDKRTISMYVTLDLGKPRSAGDKGSGGQESGIYSINTVHRKPQIHVRKR